MSEILRRAKSSLDPIINHHRQRTLEEIQGSFLNQASLTALGEMIIKKTNGGEAFTLYGIVKGTYAEEPKTDTRAQRVAANLRKLKHKILGTQNDGSMLSIAGEYVNVWWSDIETRKVYLKRELYKPTHIRGFSQKGGQRSGFTVPITTVPTTQDYRLDEARPTTANYGHKDRGLSYSSAWPEGYVTQTASNYRQIEDESHIFENRAEAIVAAMRLITKMSGLKLDWVRPEQGPVAVPAQDELTIADSLREELVVA